MCSANSPLYILVNQFLKNFAILDEILANLCLPTCWLHFPKPSRRCNEDSFFTVVCNCGNAFRVFFSCSWCSEDEMFPIICHTTYPHLPKLIGSGSTANTDNHCWLGNKVKWKLFEKNSFIFSSRDIYFQITNYLDIHSFVLNTS